MKRQAALSASKKYSRPKHVAGPAKPTRAQDRVEDSNILKQAAKLANRITQHYPMRLWARWTHHQKHGWWSHVSAGHFDTIRFTGRDFDDLEKVYQRCLDEKQFDQELLRAMDDIEEKQNALTVSIESARALLRRKARALFLEQKRG